MANSYFAILGVTADASPEEIRSAYRRLVKEFHPDHFEGGSEPFIQIQEAYAVLGDDRRRREYEKSLRQRLENPAWGHAPRPSPEPLIPKQRPPHLGNITPIGSFQTHGPRIEDPSPSPGHPFFRRVRAGFRGMENLAVEVPLTREQAARGGSVAVMIPVRAVCPECGGLGGGGFHVCRPCAGRGVISGETPVRIPFPPGLARDHAVTVSLAPLGMQGLHLTVRFHPADVF
ncbi:J domain-containing protein [Desulfococcus sp.]|uniref:J domain-containing protein n=1 Tax=Desulfococcus sp. TaxID=2025834 RepID=UPI0035943074